MSKRDTSVVGADAENSVADADQERTFIEHDREQLREFVKELSPDDITSGGWFTKLLAQSLRTYTQKVDWRYFQDRYKGLPPDAIVEQRIKMAARYAAIEGGLSASAYTGAVAATIGTLGGASPATVPAAAATLMVDLAYTTRLQLHLAYDISVLYRVPLDTTNPDDLWKLIRVAFTIRNGELVREGVLKTVPAADKNELAAMLAPDAPSIVADQLHPIIWQSAAPLWDTGEYKTAVQQAAVNLSAHVKTRVGSHLNERELVQQVFSPDLPKAGQTRLHMPGNRDDKNWKSAQEGLHLIAQGAFAGIRNIAVHGSDQWTEHEALEHLAVLSVVARWADITHEQSVQDS